MIEYLPSPSEAGDIQRSYAQKLKNKLNRQSGDMKNDPVAEFGEINIGNICSTLVC